MSTATGNFFGEQIWVIISVEVAGTMAITQQMSKLDELGKFQSNIILRSKTDFLLQEPDKEITTNLTLSEPEASSRWSELVIYWRHCL